MHTYPSIYIHTHIRVPEDSLELSQFPDDSSGGTKDPDQPLRHAAVQVAPEPKVQCTRIYCRKVSLKKSESGCEKGDVSSDFSRICVDSTKKNVPQVEYSASQVNCLPNKECSINNVPRGFQCNYNTGKGFWKMPLKLISPRESLEKIPAHSELVAPSWFSDQRHGDNSTPYESWTMVLRGFSEKMISDFHF